MKSVYETKVNTLIENFETIKKPFKWEHDMIRHLVALTFAMKDKELDIDAIKDMCNYIKKHTGAFSSYRGDMIFALSSLLCSASDNPESQFDSMLQNEGFAKSVGFKSQMYLPTALYALSSVYDGDDVQGYLEKASAIFKEMRSNHPILTSGDDYALAILLASTDHDVIVLEEYYQTLKDSGFSKSNGLQMLSHILSFSNLDIRETVNRCVRIYDQLKNNKLKVFSDFYPAIGLIALLDEDQDSLIMDLIEITSFLRKQKGYKFLGKGMNILIASSLITSQYINNNSNSTMVEAAVSISIETIIAAQQAAMIAAVVAASSAAASSAAT